MQPSQVVQHLSFVFKKSITEIFKSGETEEEKHMKPSNLSRENILVVEGLSVQTWGDRMGDEAASTTLAGPPRAHVSAKPPASEEPRSQAFAILLSSSPAN